MDVPSQQLIEYRKDRSILLIGLRRLDNILALILGEINDHGITNIDVTCHDADPAVLARLVLAFSVFATEESSEVWEDAYDFVLHDPSRPRLLRCKCKGLLSASETLTSWRNSVLSSFLTVCPDSSMEILRRHWAAWLQEEEHIYRVSTGPTNHFTCTMVDAFRSLVSQCAITIHLLTDSPRTLWSDEGTKFDMIHLQSSADHPGLLDILAEVAQPMLANVPLVVTTHKRSTEHLNVLFFFLGLIPETHPSLTHDHAQSFLWKLQRGPYRLVVGSEELSQALCHIYTKCVQTGNMRKSFVTLLGVVKERVDTAWGDAMQGLLRRIETWGGDSLYFQHLSCEIHLQNVHVVDAFSRELVVPLSPHTNRRFGRTWPFVPPIVCLIVQLPHPVLQEIHASGLMLEIQEHSRKMLNCFPALHVTSRKVYSDRLADDTVSRVATWIPFWLLDVNPDDTNVVVSSSHHREIFSTNLLDRRHVLVRPDWPAFLGAMTPAPERSVKRQRRKDLDVHVHFTKDHREISSLTIHVRVNDIIARLALIDGEEVVARQISPCEIRVSFDSFQYIALFPVPVDGSPRRLKMRVARRSCFIEICAPIIPTVSSRES
ncbi:uncharacterized protein BT62DRAFT_1075075 [Guyanagaster necrorhizus]|uniref:Uncharacterized protein n=1 Tax=Guyanagaster necrorhizus TaxID=856835 RepID=A0A9P8AU67_9AGAR|nr:uncharacterized protein BT62DRAFT_1075075 [Guyanagaster necrorhizus MCA 3950]KAG7447711.1 hypothetical protein BT62DRAFT_1075075 [Guyanagaster necrorhizus MCA 3950]